MRCANERQSRSSTVPDVRVGAGVTRALGEGGILAPVIGIATFTDPDGHWLTLFGPK